MRYGIYLGESWGNGEHLFLEAYKHKENNYSHDLYHNNHVIQKKKQTNKKQKQKQNKHKTKQKQKKTKTNKNKNKNKQKKKKNLV